MQSKRHRPTFIPPVSPLCMNALFMSAPHLSPPWQLLQLCLAALQLLLQLGSLLLTAVVQYLQLLQLHLHTGTLEDTRGHMLSLFFFLFLQRWTRLMANIETTLSVFDWNEFLIHFSKKFTRHASAPFVSYLPLNLWGLLLRLFELLPQGENLPDASVPAGWCRGLPIKWNILLDGGVHQATVPRLGHGHVTLRHDLIRASLHLLPLCALLYVFFFQWQVDTGAGPKEWTVQC